MLTRTIVAEEEKVNKGELKPLWTETLEGKMEQSKGRFLGRLKERDDDCVKEVNKDDDGSGGSGFNRQCSLEAQSQEIKLPEWAL